MAVVMEIDEQVLSAKFEVILPHLDERQRRLLLAAEARSLGYGGISLVARAAGVSRVTVTAGVPPGWRNWRPARTRCRGVRAGPAEGGCRSLRPIRRCWMRWSSREPGAIR